MATSDRFNVLLVEPDSGARGKLKQAIMALTTFHKLSSVSTLEEAMGYTSSPGIDILFLSYRISLSQIIEFIKTARGTKFGKEWAYVAIQKSISDKGDEAETDSFVQGVDGFLYEPYAADDLREIAEIAAKVKLLNEENRKKAAMLSGVHNMMTHIDSIALCQSLSRDSAGPLKCLKEAAAKLDKLRRQHPEAYFSILIEEFEKALPNAAKSYAGPSERVKKRLQEKAIRQIDEKYREEKAEEA